MVGEDVVSLVPGRPTPTKAPITNISTWMERYSIMAAAIATRFPEKRPGYLVIKGEKKSACPSPSEVGDVTPSGLKNGRDKVLPFDHRGRSLHSVCHGLHVSLQVEAFVKFIDCVNKDETCSREFFTYALEIMQKMSLFYVSEGERQSVLICK